MISSLFTFDRRAWVMLLSVVFSGMILAPGIASATPAFTASETTANVTEVKAQLTLTATTTSTSGSTMVIGRCTITFVSNDGGTNDETDCINQAATIDADTGAGNTARTAAQLITALATITNASSTLHGTTSIASPSATTLTITTTATETSATIIEFTDNAVGIGSTSERVGVIPVAQVVEFTPSDFKAGDEFTLTLNGTEYEYTSTGGTVKDVVEGLDAAAAGSSIGCTENDVTLTCTAPLAGTAFTYNSVVNSGSSGGGSSGGSSGRRKAAQNKVEATLPSGKTNEIPSVVAGTPAAKNFVFTSALSEGSTGADVTALQNRLTAEGVYTGPITGFFGPLTMAAVQAFQAKNGIETVGAVGPKTMAALNGANGVTVPPPGPTSSNALPNPAMGTTFMMNLSEGSSGDEVTALQNRLTAEGVYTGPITGFFGPLTMAAVKAFQEKNGLDAVGMVGPMTRAKLNGSGNAEVPPPGPSGNANSGAVVPPPPPVPAL